MGKPIHVREPEARQDLGGFVDHFGARTGDPPPLAAIAEPFRHREAHGLQRRQVGEELVDLEGARQPALHALMGRKET